MTGNFNPNRYFKQFQLNFGRNYSRRSQNYDDNDYTHEIFCEIFLDFFGF